MTDETEVKAETYPLAGNRFTRAIGAVIGHTIYFLMRWKIVGNLPSKAKAIIVGGPHTSNWDLFLAMGAMLQKGLRFSWMMKSEAFKGPLGALWKSLGGIPIDRKDAKSVPEQMAAWFASVETGYLGITPEGTRKAVERYRSGFLRIAYASKVPVFVVGIDARTRTVHLDKLWPLTGDLETDITAIRDYIRANYSGIRPENN
ncbi:MAG: 1-acyl-sn-glycerol-3-phosphate acyltransferase [Pseudomonadota bacterium]